MSFGQKNHWPRANSGQMNPIFQGITGQQFANIPGMIPNLNAIVNTAAFGGMLTQQQRPQMPQQSTSPQNRKKTVIGSITKLLDSYGFIDEEIFFQTNVVTGGNPMLGARCMVEAVYNASMPFKWNATSVQIFQENPAASLQQPSRGANMNRNRWEQPQHNGNDMRSRDADRGGYGSHVRESRDTRDYTRRSPVRRDRPPARRSPVPIRRSSPSPIRREKRERSRSRSPRREATRDRTASPPRRRARVLPRYSCKVPKPLVPSLMNCSDIRSRYKSLYVPSDFIQAKFDWVDSFSLENQFNIGINPVTYHVLHKDVDVLETIAKADELQPAEDEDHRFCVRTILLSHNGIVDFRKKVFGLLPDGSSDESSENLSFNKGIQFLTGIRGRSEVMALGGAWSPSKDGENPLDLPTQINTAVRKMRELVGIDLSGCQTWYKIAQLEYYRSERDRVDTIVLLMPDMNSVSGLMPSAEDYAKTIEVLKEQLSAKIAEIDAEEFVSTVEKRKKEAKAVAEEVTDSEVEATNNATTTSSVTDAAAEDASSAPEPAPVAVNESVEKMETEQAENEKIHWSASIAALRVAELRDQLALRNLDTKGVKNVLVQRLQKALDDERNAEENPQQEVVEEAAIEEPVNEDAAPDDPMDTSAAAPEKKDEIPDDPQNTVEEITIDQLVEKTEEDELTQNEIEEIKKEKERFEQAQEEKKQTLTRHFTFPEQPTVFVYPSKFAKAGRFDAKVSSLFSLLEYRIEDSKEASFEVFLFSECIHEMFDRLNGFNIYKTIENVFDHETLVAKRKEALVAALQAVEDAEKPKEGAAETEKPKDPINFAELDEAEIVTRFRSLVNNVELFSSFAYYDVNLVGYIQERDLEDILLAIGVRLSRGDVARILKRVLPRDRFNYRPFVDRYVDKNNETKFIAEFRDDAPSTETLLNIHPKVADNDSTAAEATVTPDITANGMVIYKGAAVNIKQTLDQHQEIKDEVVRLFAQVQEQEHVVKNYKEQVDTLEKKKKRLESDIAHYKKKAYEAEKCLKTNEDDVVLMKSALNDCKRYGERLITVVERVMPVKEKTKEPSTKPETPIKKDNEDPQKTEEGEETIQQNGANHDVEETETSDETATKEETSEVATTEPMEVAEATA